ncbi:uncharacterized protein [Anas platyrhynchos]|uniref:uncharacterized protein isoform X1 n=1 Tax=Anas platyrhynchos TaxID=8839 RepID=UPI003AF20F6B
MEIAVRRGKVMYCGETRDIRGRVATGDRRCQWKRQTTAIVCLSQLREITRHKRALLTPDCNDNVELLGVAARMALASLVPGVASLAALNNLEKLVCWANKQAHAMTEILEEMLPDQNSLRHTLLQARAAVDFLLLAQVHGCEDFEETCCLNLSDHNESIHKFITFLKEPMRKIQYDINPFDQWLTDLFGTMHRWLLGLVKEGLRILFVVVLIIIVCCIVINVVKGLLAKLLHQAWFAQKEKGEIVEGFLKQPGGHDLLQLSKPSYQDDYEKFP